MNGTCRQCGARSATPPGGLTRCIRCGQISRTITAPPASWTLGEPPATGVRAARSRPDQARRARIAVLAAVTLLAGVGAWSALRSPAAPDRGSDLAAVQDIARPGSQGPQMGDLRGLVSYVHEDPEPLATQAPAAAPTTRTTRPRQSQPAQETQTSSETTVVRTNQEGTVHFDYSPPRNQPDPEWFQQPRSPRTNPARPTQPRPSAPCWPPNC